MPRINIKGLQAEISAKGSNIIKRQILEKASKAIEKAKAQIIAEFDSHEVTKEIQAGPSASNSSNTLGGYGNLFTFIGFDSGSDPITPIRSLLAKSISIKSLRKKRNVFSFVLNFSVPTQEQIENVAPSPWSTESWVAAVEKGMSGLGKYLSSKEKGRFSTSRSGGAIQANFEIRGSQRSQPVEYISGILRNMLKNIENNLRKA